MAKKKQNKRQDIAIEGNVATWELQAQGSILGTYTGTFRFRCFLNPTQKLAASREFRQLVGLHPELATEHEKFLAYAISQLKYRVISAPPFWDQNPEMPGDVPDEDVITKVLEAAVDAELLYMQQKSEAKSEALKRAKSAAEKIIQEQEDEGENQADNA